MLSLSEQHGHFFLVVCSLVTCPMPGKHEKIISKIAGGDYINFKKLKNQKKN